MGLGFIKREDKGVCKIVLFNKNMDDMMHDVMMMHKRKTQTDLIGVLPWAVTKHRCIVRW
jgi:hypothetical protein